MAGAIVLSARQQLLFQVAQAYYGLQLAQENLAVVRKARGTAAEHLKIAESRFRSGDVVQADVLSAQVHLAKLRQEEMTAASQVQIGQSALGMVLGLPEAGSRPLAPPPKEPAPLRPRLADLQRTGPGATPGPQEAGTGGPLGPAGICQGRLNYLPRVHVVAEYDVDQRRLGGSGGDSYTVMALLHLQLV